MNAVLWKVGAKFIAQHGDNTGRECIKLVFKELDTNEEYKCNLPTSKLDWMKYVQEGNVFYGLGINDFGTISYYTPFTRVEVKPKNEPPKIKDSNGDDPFPNQVSLPI